MIKRLNGDILRMTIFTGAVILYLCIELFGLTGLKPVLSVFCILAIILSIYKVSFISKLFSLAFIICGSYLVWEKGMGLHNLENYIMLYGEMIYILTLFVIVLLMPIPIKVGGYREAIETFLNKFITKPSELHMAIMLFSYVLGIFLNLATPALMYASTKDFIDRFPLRNKKKFITISITQGFGLAMFWTPFSAVVGLVIITTETNWLNIFLVLFLTSIFCLMSSWIIFYLFRSKYKINLSDSSVLENKNVPMDNNLDISGKKKLIELCVAITILVILLMVLDQLLSYGLVMIVTLVCLPTVMVWSLLLKKTKKCFKEIYYHFSYFVPNMTENFSIFLSAGFFVNVLRYTGYDVLINEQLIFIKELIGMSLFLIFLPMIIIIFSFLGVHPMVLIALIAESLHPIKLGIDSEELALSLIFGGVMTYMIGPFSGTLGLMSTIMKTTAFRIISWNLIGVSVFFLITLCTIIIYRML